ncbi:MAG: carbohydrate kinase family protein [Thermaerobacter sp.]|nr:carbohydrate kinase family protein [Thermaerobacter sp.]
MPDVLVVGDAAWDTVVRVAAEPAFNRDTPASIHSGPGGQGFNMAVAASRQGVSVALVTQVGTDAQSRALVAAIRRYGVGLPRLTRTDPLTRVVAMVRPDGERALLTDPGPGPLREPDSRLAAGMLLLSGYLTDRAGGVERVRAWLDWAAARNMPVLLDPAHPRLAARCRPFLSGVGWLLANQAEWTALGRPTSRPALIKRGAEGALLLSGGESVVIRAPAGVVVDTTGAGDAVAGAFAAGLALGRTPAEAARLAVARGTAVCGQLGSV